MLLPELVLMRLMFVLIGTENYGLAMVGVAVATIPRCLHYAALAGMLASRFPAHLRYTGISTGPYGRTIAHGYMVLSWGIPMFGELLQVQGVGRALNYGVNKVRYPAPVPVGNRVRLHASVIGVEEVARGGVQMTRAFTFELEGSEKPGCAAESLTHFYP